jgi:hypothetical protein
MGLFIILLLLLMDIVITRDDGFFENADNFDGSSMVVKYAPKLNINNRVVYLSDFLIYSNNLTIRDCLIYSDFENLYVGDLLELEVFNSRFVFINDMNFITNDNHLAKMRYYFKNILNYYSFHNIKLTNVTLSYIADII